jgi:hypothetical protein
MSWADATQQNMLWVQGIALFVSASTLGVLVWYAIETFKLRKAAEGQITVSRNLLRAANDQAEGASKPYITIRAKLRDTSRTLIAKDGAVGGSVVFDETGHYQAVNVGNGIALNVAYFFKARPDSDRPWEKKAQSYLQTLQLDQPAQLALLINAYPGDHEITFLFQSLGGRWYESIIRIESKVPTDSRFRQLPESFHPSTSELP